MRADGMPEKLLRLIKDNYQSTRARVRAYGEESETFEVKTGVRQGCALSPTLFNYTIDYILVRALQDNAGSECLGVWSSLRGRHRLGRVELWRCAGGAQMWASCSRGCGYDHKCLKDQSNAISGWSSQLAVIDAGRGQSGGHAVFCLSRLNNNAVGANCSWGESPYRSCKVCIRASQAFTMWVTRDIHGYERAHLSSHCPDDPPLWLRNVATSSGWPTKDWSVRQQFLRYILRCHRVDRVPTTTLRRRLNLRPLPTVLLQRRLRWFGNAARRPEGELIRDVLLPPSLPNGRKRVSGQLKTWASTIKNDLAALSGPQVVGLRWWNRDWLSISCELAQD